MIAAPASAAPMAASAISSGVTGRCGDIDGVWIDPVTAQVMMTFRAMGYAPALGQSDGRALRGEIRDQLAGGLAHQPLIGGDDEGGHADLAEPCSLARVRRH